jgi:hypothetical protein
MCRRNTYLMMPRQSVWKSTSNEWYLQKVAWAKRQLATQIDGNFFHSPHSTILHNVLVVKYMLVLQYKWTPYNTSTNVQSLDNKDKASCRSRSPFAAARGTLKNPRDVFNNCDLVAEIGRMLKRLSIFLLLCSTKERQFLKSVRGFYRILKHVYKNDEFSLLYLA